MLQRNAGFERDGRSEQKVDVRLTGWLILVAIAVLANIAIVVPLPLIASSGGEFWWPVALHTAFLDGLEFGTEIAFTYGPFGFLAEGFHPDTYGTVLLMRSVVVAVALLALWSVGSEASLRHGRIRVLAVLALTPLVVNVCWNATFFLWLPFLILIVGSSRSDRSRRALVVLATLAGLVSLVKFSYGVMLLAAIGILTLRDTMERRRPSALAAWSVSLVCFWVIAGQSLLNIPSWVLSSAQIAMGYNACQGRDDDAFGVGPQWLLLFFVISMTVFVAVSSWLEWQRDRRRSVVHLVGWSMLGLLLTKAGFVRADEWHMGPAIGALFLSQLTWAAIAFETGRSGRLRRPLLAGLCLSILVSMSLVKVFMPGGVEKAVSATVIGAIVAGSELMNPVSMKSMREEERRHAILAENESGELPKVIGSVDAYPTPLGALFERGAVYRPRPVIRSLDTYSPSLARRNLRHLEEAPPETILFSIAPIDGRLPSLEESESWPLLWAKYSREGRVGDTLRLRLSEPRGRFEMVEVGRSNGTMGELLDVPEVNGALYASFDLRPTLAGRVLTLVRRAPHLKIQLERYDGVRRTFRFVAMMATKPIMLSPLVEDLDGFEKVASGVDLGTPGERVRSISLSPELEATPALWAKDWRVTWYRIDRPENSLP